MKKQVELRVEVFDEFTASQRNQLEATAARITAFFVTGATLSLCTLG